MAHIHSVRIPARPSRQGADETYYVSSGVNWHKHARRFQVRQKHKLHHLVEPAPLYGRVGRGL